MIALPTTILFFVAALTARVRRGDWWLPLGLLFSALGDGAGSLGAFYPQMGLFAAALLCYIRSFAPDVRFAAKRLGALVVVGALFVAAFGWLAGHIPSHGERLLVAGYALLLLSLWVATILLRRPYWGLSALAAALFVLSDALIGYVRFVEPLYLADLWILSTYYAAQTLFTADFLIRN